VKKYKYLLVAMVLAVIAVYFQVQTATTSQAVYAACQTPQQLDPKNPQPVSQNCIYTSYITPAINFLSIGVGVVVLAMIIIGAIQYSASNGNPQAVNAAKKRIFNAILALIVFAFSYALLNFLIPGGLLPP
jgi:hypothetical protein